MTDHRDHKRKHPNTCCVCNRTKKKDNIDTYKGPDNRYYCDICFDEWFYFDDNGNMVEM